MSALEETLAFQLRAAGIAYQREFKAVADRKYRWDFAIVPHRLLIEVHGAVHVKGAHSTGKGITRDAEKLNLGCIAGWRQMVLVREQIESGKGLRWIQEAIARGVA